MPEEQIGYIEGWKRMNPGWEIIRIDESVFDPSCTPYTMQAARKGQWSFVSDVARLWFLKNYGGFYLDTDVELYRGLEEMRDCKAVVCEMAPNFFNGHCMACEPGYWPGIFQEAEEVANDTRVLQHILTVAAHRRYDLTAEDFTLRAGIAFYGIAYSANARSPRLPKTFLRHHEANSWCGGWTPGFAIGDDVLPLDVKGIHDVERIGKPGEETIGRATVLNPNMNDPLGTIIDASNMLYNRDIVRVDGGDFIIRRYHANWSKKTIRRGEWLITC